MFVHIPACFICRRNESRSPRLGPKMIEIQQCTIYRTYDTEPVVTGNLPSLLNLSYFSNLPNAQQSAREASSKGLSIIIIIIRIRMKMINFNSYPSLLEVSFIIETPLRSPFDN